MADDLTSKLGQFSDFIDVPFSFDQDLATQLSDRLGLQHGLKAPVVPEPISRGDELESTTRLRGEHLKFAHEKVSDKNRVLARLLTSRARLLLGESPFTDGGFMKMDMAVPMLPILQ